MPLNIVLRLGNTDRYCGPYLEWNLRQKHKEASRCEAQYHGHLLFNEASVVPREFSYMVRGIIIPDALVAVHHVYTSVLGLL